MQGTSQTILGSWSVGLASLLIASCAGTVPVDGFAFDRSTWAHDEWEVRARASIDLKCPEGKIKLKVLDTVRERNAAVNEARQIRADGCGYHVDYEKANGLWEVEPSETAGR
jgi:hypothetical protein